MATISDKPWNGAASGYKDAAAFCAACLIDENEPGTEKIQAKCHLPVRTPDGAISRNGVHNAASRLMQTKTSSANKKMAARKLKRLYGELHDPVPDNVKNMAM